MEEQFYSQMREAFLRLGAGLSAGQKEYVADKTGGATVALQAVTQFVQSVADFEDRGFATPLVALLAGMHDLEKGTVSPILTPRQCRGRSPDQTLLETVRGAAVFCLDALIKAGGSPVSACDIVARSPRLKVFLKGHRDTTHATVLKGWRGGKSRWTKYSAAKLIYEKLTREMAHVEFQTPEHAWKCLEPMLEGMIEGFSSALN